MGKRQKEILTGFVLLVLSTLFFVAVINATITSPQISTFYPSNAINSSGFDITLMVNLSDYNSTNSTTYYNLSNTIDYIQISNWTNTIPTNSTIHNVTALCYAANTTSGNNNTFSYNVSLEWNNNTCSEVYGNGNYSFKCDLTSFITNYTLANSLQIRCSVSNSSASEEIDYVSLDINYTPPDLYSPVVSLVNPTQGQSLAAGTTETLINITTDEIAICRYSTDASLISWGSMLNFTFTNSTSHSRTRTDLANGTTYYEYFLCEDSLLNVMNETTNLTFSVASPSSPSNDDDDNDNNNDNDNSGAGNTAGFFDTSSCDESWNCGTWSSCVDGIKTRTCTDKNDCGTTSEKPAITATCEEGNETGSNNTITGGVVASDAGLFTGFTTAFDTFIDFTKENTAIFVLVFLTVVVLLGIKFNIPSKIRELRDLRIEITKVPHHINKQIDKKLRERKRDIREKRLREIGGQPTFPGFRDKT